MVILKVGEKHPRRTVCQSTYLINTTKDKNGNFENRRKTTKETSVSIYIFNIIRSIFSVLVRHLYAFKKIYSNYRIYVHCMDDTALCKESVCLFICLSVVLPRDFYATIVGE